jgi:hypothetical protein
MRNHNLLRKAITLRSTETIINKEGFIEYED